MSKRPYQKPAIVHTEKLEGRAVECAKADQTFCAEGPIQS
jgi:hypothetical protein